MKEHIITRASLVQLAQSSNAARTEEQRGPKGVLLVLLASSADSKPQVGHLRVLG